MAEIRKINVDMENFGFLQGRINENEKRIKKLEDFRTENCPHYVTGCFHVLEQRKIIETQKTQYNSLDYQKKELFEKWRERTEDAKHYMLNNKEALKIWKDFINNDKDQDALNCIGEMVNALKKV